MFRRRRDEQAWSTWEEMLTHAAGWAERTPTLVTVIAVRQRARSGTKAYLRFSGTSVVCAAWFPDRWPHVGTHHVVSGHLWDDVASTHHRETVFWVDFVHATAAGDVVRRWRRHERKLRRRAGSGNGPQISLS
jgi:hypothetical protein